MNCRQIPFKATNSPPEQQTQISSVGSSQGEQGSSHCTQPLGLDCSSDLIIEEFAFKSCLKTPARLSEDADSPAPWEPAAARGHTRLAERWFCKPHCRHGKEPQALGRVFLLYQTTRVRGVISPRIAVAQRAGGCRQHQLNI